MESAMSGMNFATCRYAVADFETDPFGTVETIKPFAAGLMLDNGEYWNHWGDDCADALLDKIASLEEPFIVFFHNGGNFDAAFIQHRLPSQGILMIGSRAVKMSFGIHEIRDSFAIIPQSLESANDKVKLSNAIGDRVSLKPKKWKKEDDYWIMEKEFREEFKDVIQDYLFYDCLYLKEIVEGFIAEFGPKKKGRGKQKATLPLTAASAAFKKLSSMCGRDSPVFEKNDEGKASISPACLKKFREHDATFRLRFYSGGRVQMFEKGVIHGDFKLYDVNSMYPAAMRNFKHPFGKKYGVITAESGRLKLTKDNWIKGFEKSQMTYFIEFEGVASGFPTRVKEGAHVFNSFAKRAGRHFLCSHEFRTGLELGYIKVDRLICAWVSTRTSDFSKFVNHYYGLRKEVKSRMKEITKTEGLDKTIWTDEIRIEYKGLAIRETMYKLALNSAYGKFALNFMRYKKKAFVNVDMGDADLETLKAEGYTIVDTPLKDELTGYDKAYVMAAAPGPEDERYEDVAIAASITSAARAVLMRALHHAVRPIYCDTDSIICESMGEGADIGSELGQWKLEHEGIYKIAVAAKKVYAFWYEEGSKKKSYVRAKGLSKNVTVYDETNDNYESAEVDAGMIEKVALGKSVRAKSVAPTIRVGKETSFREVTIKMIGKTEKLERVG